MRALGVNMNSFKFSIITAFYNTGEYLKDSIESVINQDIGFKDNVQLILIDDGSTDNSKEIALSYQKSYPNNIIVVSKENGGVASARNLGLNYVKGEFVNFLDSDDKFSKNSLRVINNFYNKHPDVSLVCMPIKYFDKKEGEHHLNYKFDSERVIDLNYEYYSTLFHVSSSFIKHDIIDNYKFNTKVVNGSDGLFINEILIDLKKYGVVNSTYYNYRKRQDSSSIMDNAKYSKRFFTEKMKLYYSHLIDYSIKKEGHVLDFIQYTIALDLNGIIASPFFSELITEQSEIKEFWDCLSNILSYIDENIILNHKYLKEFFKSFYIYLKNDKEFHIEARPEKHKVFLKSNEFIINKLHNHKIHFNYLTIDNNQLILKGSHVSSCKKGALSFDVMLKTHYGEEKIFKSNKLDLKHNYENGFLGIKWLFSYDFEFKIPLNEYNNFKLMFLLKYDENGQNVLMCPNIRFKDSCNFTNDYLKLGSSIILFRNNEIHLVPYSFKFNMKLKFNKLI